MPERGLDNYIRRRIPTEELNNDGGVHLGDPVLDAPDAGGSGTK